MIDVPHVPVLTEAQLADRRRHLLAAAAAAPPRRPVRPLLAAAVVGAAASVVLGALFVARQGTPPAYAGWSAVPTPATPAQAARAATLCRAMAPVPAGSEVVVAERRGPAAFLVFASALDSSSCLLRHPDADGPGAGEGGAGGGVNPDATAMLRPSGGGVDVLAGEGEGSSAQDEGASAIYGRSGPDVRAIVVVRADGRTVTAEVGADGWWSAWWPGDDVTPEALQVTSSDGTTVTGPVPYARR